METLSFCFILTVYSYKKILPIGSELIIVTLCHLCHGIITSPHTTETLMTVNA